MLKIWGRRNSINVQKALWCCAELGLQYERVDAGLAFGVNNTAEYKALNPNGLVPTIDDDGFVMWESAGINLYLAEKYKSPLWPADIKGKGRMLQWAFFAANDVEPNMITVMQHRVMFPPEKRNASSSGSPITISAPVRAWTMLSMPSRSAVPGATISSAFTSRGSWRPSSSVSSSPERCAIKADSSSVFSLTLGSSTPRQAARCARWPLDKAV